MLEVERLKQTGKTVDYSIYVLRVSLDLMAMTGIATLRRGGRGGFAPGERRAVRMSGKTRRGPQGLAG
ncbi:hypothetical protein [Methylobacterium sp. JK268]